MQLQNFEDLGIPELSNVRVILRDFQFLNYQFLNFQFLNYLAKFLRSEAAQKLHDSEPLGILDLSEVSKLY